MANSLHTFWKSAYEFATVEWSSFAGVKWQCKETKSSAFDGILQITDSANKSYYFLEICEFVEMQIGKGNFGMYV